MALQKTVSDKNYINLSFSYQENGQDKKVELEHVRSYKYFGWILKVLGKASLITFEEGRGEAIYVNRNSLVKSLYFRAVDDLNSENYQDLERIAIDNEKITKKNVKSLKTLLRKNIKEIKGDKRDTIGESSSISNVYVKTTLSVAFAVHYSKILLEQKNNGSEEQKDRGSEYLYHHYRNTPGTTDEEREYVFKMFCNLHFLLFKKQDPKYKSTKVKYDSINGKGKFDVFKLNDIKNSEKMVKCREELGLPQNNFNV